MSVSFSTITQKARMQPVPATTAAMRRALTYIPPTTVSALKNGVRIAAEENPNNKFATVGIWMDIGTKSQNRHHDGIFKVLQEASFQGTVGHDRKSLNQALDECGGHLMTKVGREHSYVAVKCLRENVPKAVSILSEVVRNARLSAEDVNAAKAVVENARNQAEEDPDSLTFDNLHICAYDASEDGGLGLSVNGSYHGIKNVTPQDVQAFRKKHYTGPRMMLVGSGGVNHTELENLAQQHLGDLPSENNKVKAGGVNTRYVGGDYRLWNLRMKTIHCAWAFETMGAASGDSVALQLATHIHSGYHRSQHELGQHAIHRVIKMFSSVDFCNPSESPMPAEGPETLRPFYLPYEDTGLCGMYMSLRQFKTSPGFANNFNDELQFTMLEWARMAQKMIVPQELDQAKVNMKAQLLFNQDGATNGFEDIGKQVFHFGRRVPLDEMYARIDDITPNNMMEVLQHYYFARRPVVSAYGYVAGLMDYGNMIHWTYKYWY